MREQPANHCAQALENLYQAFATQKKPPSISACACCVDAREIRVLLNAPLRGLTCQQLTSYAASVFLTAGDGSDFRYLLPRLLEVFVLKAEGWPDVEVMLSKLRLAKWRQWSGPEQQAVMAFLEAVFDERLHRGEDAAWEIDALVCGMAQADIDMAPFLRKLEDPSVREVLCGFFERNSAGLAKGKLTNAFWDDDAAAAPVLAWLQSPEVQNLVWTHDGAA